MNLQKTLIVPLLAAIFYGTYLIDKKYINVGNPYEELHIVGFLFFVLLIFFPKKISNRKPQ